MSSTTDQVERMAKEISILKFHEELENCETIEDFQALKEQYKSLAMEISLRNNG